MSVSVLFAAALAATSFPVDVELFGGLRSGMSKAEAEAALIDKERFLTSSCQMTIKKVYEAGRLKSVILRNKWKIEKNDCYEPISATLVEKYGEPDGLETDPGISGIIPPGLSEIWIEGERVIVLTRRRRDTVLEYKTETTAKAPERVKGL